MFCKSFYIYPSFVQRPEFVGTHTKHTAESTLRFFVVGTHTQFLLAILICRNYHVLEQEA